MTSIEELAERAADEIAQYPATVVVPPKPTVCPWCFGMGIERSQWAFLWGGNCWVCGGWGVLEGNRLVMRGPFAPRPGRYGAQGGQQ